MPVTQAIPGKFMYGGSAYGRSSKTGASLYDPNANRQAGSVSRVGDSGLAKWLLDNGAISESEMASGNFDPQKALAALYKSQNGGAADTNNRWAGFSRQMRQGGGGWFDKTI